jgi:hypothetical protein
MTFTPSVYLRRVLLLDAVATFATGVLLLGGMSLLQSLLNLPISLMTYAGVFCVAWAALVGFAFTRRQLTRGFVWTIVIGNALWALGSLALLVSGYAAPTVLGHAFVIAQAVVVGVFAELQYIGLTRPSPQNARA